MAEGAQRVRVEEADWSILLPFIRFFRSFRMAFEPGKLFTALMLIVLLYLSGVLLDQVWGRPVYVEEIETYASRPLDEYDAWMQSREDELKSKLYSIVFRTSDANAAMALVNDPNRFYKAVKQVQADFAMREDNIRRGAADHKVDPTEQIQRLADERRMVLEQILAVEPRGIFDSALHFSTDSFERLMSGAISLNLGLTDTLRGLPHDSGSVAGALDDMLVVLPGWMYQTHRGFLVVYCLIAGVLLAVFGGAISRMAALHAIGDRRLSPTAAIRFSISRLAWFILAPLIPAVLGLALAFLLFLFGLFLFGIPYLRVALGVLGGLLFVVPLMLGLVIGLIFLGLVLGGSLLYPAIAVEGSDGFDANSRAYSYVVGRPWQLLFYCLLMLIYGAVTYIFVGIVVFLTLLAARSCLAAGMSAADTIFRTGGVTSARFDAMLKPPQIDRLSYEIDWSDLDGPSKISAILIQTWVYLFVGLLAAYAVSYYYCAFTWIYLLLRPFWPMERIWMRCSSMHLPPET